MRKNPYKTNDPELLLRLKRQEADALRDVLKSLNQAHLRPEHIFKVARNTLMAQCEVKKMKFIYRTEEGMQIGAQRGFGPFLPQVEKELPNELRTLRVDPGLQPALAEMGVEYVVPINFKNQVDAWFLVADFAETEAEVENDLIFIEIIGNVVSAALENRGLLQEMVEKESLRRELQVAERIQKQLLTTDFGLVEGAAVYAENYAHHHIGGDFYDVIPRGDKGFFVCIADVAGKGIGAALLMANLQANLRALILSENDLKAVIHKLHILLFGITKGEQFVTFFFAHVRTKSQEIDYINAGHNPPILIQSGNLVQLDKGTIPLGIIDLPPDIEEATVKYEKGDALFMYTDGLMEQNNPHDEMIGEERIQECFHAVSTLGVKEIVAGMREFYEEFKGDAVQEDDVTFLAIKF